MNKKIIFTTVFIVFILFQNNVYKAAANNLTISYDSTYRLEKELKKIDYDIKKNYAEIRKIKRSTSLTDSEKQIKTRRLEYEIQNQKREARRIKQKCRRIIS